MRITPQTVMVLKMLKFRGDAWTYGYDISKMTGLKSGTLYPILSRLHECGWLCAEWVTTEPGRPARHHYKLTATGLKASEQALSTPPRKLCLQTIGV